MDRIQANIKSQQKQAEETRKFLEEFILFFELNGLTLGQPQAVHDEIVWLVKDGDINRFEELKARFYEHTHQPKEKVD